MAFASRSDNFSSLKIGMGEGGFLSRDMKSFDGFRLDESGWQVEQRFWYNFSPFGGATAFVDLDGAAPATEENKGINRIIKRFVFMGPFPVRDLKTEK